MVSDRLLGSLTPAQDQTVVEKEYCERIGGGRNRGADPLSAVQLTRQACDGHECLGRQLRKHPILRRGQRCLRSGTLPEGHAKDHGSKGLFSRGLYPGKFSLHVKRDFENAAQGGPVEELNGIQIQTS